MHKVSVLKHADAVYQPAVKESILKISTKCSGTIMVL